MSRDFQPDAQWLHDRWVEEVRDHVFDDARPSTSPVFVVLGGQPGAGKTAAAERAAQLHPDEALTVIEGDDYRQFHPDYKTLMRDDPVRMPEVTQTVSGPMVAAAVEHAQRERLSVTLEGTFRDPQLVSNTTEEFHRSGFYVHAVVVAVPPVQSLISTVDRFVSAAEQGRGSRWTPASAHDAALAGMPATVKALGESQVVDQVTVVQRDGTVLVDLSGPGSVERGQSAVRALAAEQRRPLSSAERSAWLQLHGRLDQAFRDLPSLRHIRHDDQVERSWSQLDQARSHVIATTGETRTHGRRPGPVMEAAPLLGAQLTRGRDSGRER